MVDNFEKRGRDVSPTQQELGFLFSLMARGLTPKQIVDEYQDTEYPLRQHRWVSEKQRYFDAAKKVLEERIKANQDPLMLEALRKHFDELYSLIDKLEHQIRLIDEFGPGYKVQWKLLDDYEGYRFSRIGEDVTTRLRICNQEVVKFYLEIETSEPLFPCIRNHLPSKIWTMYEEWKKLCRSSLQSDLNYVLDKTTWDGDLAVKLVDQQTDAGEALISALSIARLRRVFPGKCDACP